MQELTIAQMSEMDGRIGFRARFFTGFLCGASLAAAFLITPTPSGITRMLIYATVVSSCGATFFI